MTRLNSRLVTVSYDEQQNSEPGKGKNQEICYDYSF